jgi:hypothetical protein
MQLQCCPYEDFVLRIQENFCVSEVYVTDLIFVFSTSNPTQPTLKSHHLLNIFIAMSHYALTEKLILISRIFLNKTIFPKLSINS